MSKPKLLIRVWSNNTDGDLFTPEAYEELLSTMSTGDFHTHRKEEVIGSGFKGITRAEFLGGELPEDLRDCYADTVHVLKQYRVDEVLAFVLYRTSELRYFKNGRASMHVRTTYHVDVWYGRGDHRANGSKRGFTNKAEALKHFNYAQTLYRIPAKGVKRG